jgi:hypothetical protein
MKEIQLTQGKVVLVSDGMFNIVSVYNWHAHWQGYAWRAVGWVDGKKVLMHRFIMGTLGHDISGMHVDHKDGDPLNNQTDNLRVATHSQSERNRCTPSSNTSGFKGVFQVKKNGVWCGTWKVLVGCNGKQHYGGCFGNKLEAHHAAVALREKLHGEFVNHGK